MSINFPTTLDTTTQLPTEASSTPLSTNHVTAHTNLAAAIIALETKIGINSSAVTTSHDYKLSGVTGTDKAASLTGIEAFSNKTLTSPIINNPDISVGSDATGDIWYRNSGGHVARLGVGSNTNVLTLVAGLPAWVAPTTVVNADQTTKGVVEIATAAEITAGTATGSTGASLAITPDQLALSTPVFNGSGLTNVILFKNGTTTRADNASGSTQNIAHGLGRIPKKIRITAIDSRSFNVWGVFHSVGVYNGTTTSAVYFGEHVTTAGANATGVDTSNIIHIENDSGVIIQATVTFDATNIILVWGNGAGSGTTVQVLWEAEG